jgi:hypothetical protein
MKLHAVNIRPRHGERLSQNPTTVVSPSCKEAHKSVNFTNKPHAGL